MHRVDKQERERGGGLWRLRGEQELERGSPGFALNGDAAVVQIRNRPGNRKASPLPLRCVSDPGRVTRHTQAQFSVIRQQREVLGKPLHLLRQIFARDLRIAGSMTLLSEPRWDIPDRRGNLGAAQSLA